MDEYASISSGLHNVSCDENEEHVKDENYVDALIQSDCVDNKSLVASLNELSATSTYREYTVDGGASFHMIGNKSLFGSYNEGGNSKHKIAIGNGVNLKVHGIDTTEINHEVLDDVLHVDNMREILLSLYRCEQSGYKLDF